MNEIIQRQLQNFGLSEKETKIYLALLELEAATVFEAAKQSGINRSSAYVVLEGLKKKGLVGVSEDKKTRRYIAASPETLLYAATTAAKKHEELKDQIQSIIPELKALHKGTKRRPVVKVFEGENGIRELYWSLFSTPNNDKTLRTFANPINLFRYMPDFSEHDKERGKRGIKMYAINPLNKEMENFYKIEKPNKPVEIVFIPEHRFKFTSDLGIFGNKISISSPKDNFGIIIESEDIANMIKDTFDLAWEEAKRLNNKKSIRVALKK